MKKDGDEIIGAKEAAEILQISYTHFLKLLREKKITVPFSKLGKHARFKKRDVENYFQKTFTYTESELSKEG